MRLNLACLTALLLLAVSGCSQKQERFAGYAPSSAGTTQSERAIKKHLAYEHEVRIETEESRVAPLLHTAEDLCLKDSADACDILDSRITAGTGASASISVRAKAEGIRKIIDALGKQGEIASQSTKADDLTAPIQDDGKKLEMLADYRAKLETLRGRANNDIESLIKINKELAQTQSEIESLTEQQARLNLRVETQLLNVYIGTAGHQSSWQPVGEALRGFGENLSQGIASAITGLAYLIPWSLVALMFVSVIRFFWRRWRRPKKA